MHRVESRTRRSYTERVPKRSSRDAQTLKVRLDALVLATDGAARREADPVGFVHAYTDTRDRELVGLVASSLAFGNVTAIRTSVSRALAALGERPSAYARETPETTLARQYAGFVHRVYRGNHLARLIANAGALQRTHGTLGAYFASLLAASDNALEPALITFADALRGPSPEPGLRHLVPDPRAGSACKRLLLYLRWMIRPDDGVDLGLWPISPSLLVIPVDTHIHRIAKNLRLTERNDASLRTAHEITDALRVLDADDPVRYDFALCHLGVSRACPSRRDEALCGACSLRDVCRHWVTASGKARSGPRAP